MISSTTKTWVTALSRPSRLRTTAYTRISTIKPKSQCQPALLKTPTPRQFSQSFRFAYPRKDSQDKDSINTEATEYSKSATDDEGARQEDAAFNPDITDPQEEKDTAGEGTGEGTDTNNPLDVSPANPDVSKQRSKTEGGAENSSASSDTTSDRQRSSGSGGPQKGSKVS